MDVMPSLLREPPT